MFYKRRDYTCGKWTQPKSFNSRVPGSSVEGKDVIILDDMISSGDSILDVAKTVKEPHVKRILQLLHLDSLQMDWISSMKPMKVV